MVFTNFLAYLIVKILERKGKLLPLWYSCDAKIKPSLVVVDILDMRLAVLRNPQLKLVLFASSTRPRQVS